MAEPTEAFTLTASEQTTDSTVNGSATNTATILDNDVSVTTSNDLIVDEDDLPIIGNNDSAAGDDDQVLSGTIVYCPRGIHWHPPSRLHSRWMCHR
ncbi:hypothetical protein HLB35_08525 [Halomonas sp. TBZ9]|uniref:Uncharacterized protein n=1 Tax=Vreelandella azerica TaxID=2732867 RepID=A0A7Y3XB00_9GAMM|nr:hypothetical protein [Halomonas azerica]NOG31801.1 hypothetical protein [Halomonas azerica]